jgi:hypothetical protein
MMVAPYVFCRVPPMLVPLCLCLYKPSRVPPSSSSLSHSLFFFNTKLYITKYNASLDLTFLRSSVLYFYVNQVSKVYPSIL